MPRVATHPRPPLTKFERQALVFHRRPRRAIGAAAPRRAPSALGAVDQPGVSPPAASPATWLPPRPGPAWLPEVVALELLEDQRVAGLAAAADARAAAPFLT